MKKKYVYVVFDSRAHYDIDVASVIFATDSLDEAIQEAEEGEAGYVVVRYREHPRKPTQLIDATIVHRCALPPLET